MMKLNRIDSSVVKPTDFFMTLDIIMSEFTEVWYRAKLLFSDEA
jgi:hypothetical protein